MTGLPVSSLSQLKTLSHSALATVNLNFFSSGFLSPGLADSLPDLPGSSALATRMGSAAQTQATPIPRRTRTARLTQHGVAGSDRMIVPTPSVAERDESAGTNMDGSVSSSLDAPTPCGPKTPATIPLQSLRSAKSLQFHEQNGDCSKERVLPSRRFPGPRWSSLVLVPKLCLGPQASKLCFVAPTSDQGRRLLRGCRPHEAELRGGAFPSRAWERGEIGAKPPDVPCYRLATWQTGRACAPYSFSLRALISLSGSGFAMASCSV